MKKLLSVLCTALLTMALLSGCGSDSDSGNTANTSGGGAPSSGGLTGELKLGIWPEDTQTEDIALHETYVAKMKEIHPGIKVTGQNYSYKTDTFVSLAESGNLPTLFSTWFTEPQKLIDGAFVADISAEMKEKGWDQIMTPSIKALLSKDGKIYGLPSTAYALGLMINIELFEEAGLMENGLPKYPKTMAELTETCIKIKEATGAAGLCLLAKDNAGGWHYTNIAWNFGAEFEKQDSDGRWLAQLDTPESIEAMQWVKDMKWTHDVLTADPTVEDWGTGFQQLGTGGAAMYIAANDAVSQPTFTNGLPVDKLALVPLPAGPNGDQYLLMGGTPFMFSKTATHDEIMAAFDYLELMGQAPVLTEESKSGMRDGAQLNVEKGIPNIDPFPVWNAPDFEAERAAVAKEYSNTNNAFYKDYFDMVRAAGKLHPEEPVATQDLYAELTKVLQAVLTDKNSDVKALLVQANTNFQKILDDTVNK